MPKLPNPWLILVAVLVFAACVFGAFYRGRYVQHEFDQAAQLKAVEQAISNTKAQMLAAEQITTMVDTAAASEAQKTDTVYRTIEKRIPVYVQVHDSAVPVWVVRVLNAAARGDLAQLSAASGLSDYDASGIDLNALARVVEQNYKTCNDWRRALNTWSDWYSKQSTAWNAFASKH